MQTYGHHAQINEDGTGLTTEQRLQLALITPDHVDAMKQGQVRAVTQNRIRSAMAELAHGNVENVHRWMSQLADGVRGDDGKFVTLPNPRAALECFVELAQFSLPKLKAVAVDVRSSDGSVKTLSMVDLEKIVSEQ